MVSAPGFCLAFMPWLHRCWTTHNQLKEILSSPAPPLQVVYVMVFSSAMESKLWQRSIELEVSNTVPRVFFSKKKKTRKKKSELILWFATKNFDLFNRQKRRRLKSVIQRCPFVWLWTWHWMTSIIILNWEALLPIIFGELFCCIFLHQKFSMSLSGPWTCSALTSASQVLELQAGANMPGGKHA